MIDTVKRLTIEGFKSIRKLENFELRPLNVLIGANGAGKSNFVEFFHILHELVEKRLQVAIGTAGGTDSFLHLGPKETKQILGKVCFGIGWDYGYEFTLVPAADGRLLLADETLVFANEAVDLSGPLPHRVLLDSGHTEAKLKDRWREEFGWAGTGREGVPDWVYHGLSDLRVYHFNDTNATAGVRRQIAIDQNSHLYADASNLAAFLYRLSLSDREQYAKIRDVVRLAAPFFDDFELHPIRLNRHLIQLEWTQKDSKYPFLASQLSDGTLRFICLATALLQPSPPATMIFDEPELGLHPYALTLLAGLFQQTAQKYRHVIVSTQSAQLLNEFDPDNVVVVERTNKGSVFRRLDPNQLSGWLEDYTLGELWQKNVLGGGPRNEEIPLPSEGDEDATVAPHKEASSSGDKRS